MLGIDFSEESNEIVNVVFTISHILPQIRLRPQRTPQVYQAFLVMFLPVYFLAYFLNGGGELCVSLQPHPQECEMLKHWSCCLFIENCLCDTLTQRQSSSHIATAIIIF